MKKKKKPRKASIAKLIFVQRKRTVNCVTISAGRQHGALSFSRNEKTKQSISNQYQN